MADAGKQKTAKKPGKKAMKRMGQDAARAVRASEQAVDKYIKGTGPELLRIGTVTGVHGNRFTVKAENGTERQYGIRGSLTIAGRPAKDVMSYLSLKGGSDVIVDDSHIQGVITSEDSYKIHEWRAKKGAMGITRKSRSGSGSRSSRGSRGSTRSNRSRNTVNLSAGLPASGEKNAYVPGAPPEGFGWNLANTKLRAEGAVGRASTRKLAHKEAKSQAKVAKVLEKEAKNRNMDANAAAARAAADKARGVKTVVTEVKLPKAKKVIKFGFRNDD